MNGTTIQGREVHPQTFQTNLAGLYSYDIARSGALTYDLYGNRLNSVPYPGCRQSNRSTKRGLVWKTSVPRSRLARRCDGGLLIGRPCNNLKGHASWQRVKRSACSKSPPESGCETTSEGRTDNPAIRSPTSRPQDGSPLNMIYCLAS